MNLFDVSDTIYESTVMIHTGSNPASFKEVKGFVMGNLAVTESIDTYIGWKITHIPSGYAVSRRAYTDEQLAIRFMKELQPITDWSQSVEQLRILPSLRLDIESARLRAEKY